MNYNCLSAKPGFENMASTPTTTSRRRGRVRVMSRPLVLLLFLACVTCSNQFQHQLDFSSQANDQQVDTNTPLAIQMALVSAKGSLAFWRPTANEPSNMQTTSANGNYYASSSAKGVRFTQPFSSKCPQLANLVVGSATTSTSTNTAPNSRQRSEVLAIEGGALKLNFVIIAHRLLAPSAAAAAQVHESSSQHAHTASSASAQPQTSSSPWHQQQQPVNSKLALHWTKNGQVLQVNSGRGGSGSGRFRQQVIENHHMLNEFLMSATDQTAGLLAQFQNNSLPPINNNHQQINYHLHDSHSKASRTGNVLYSSNDLTSDAFMLAPFVVNEALIERAEENNRQQGGFHYDSASQIQLSGPQQSQQQQQPQQSRQQQHTLSKRILAQAATTGDQPNLVDEFLAEGNSIDWLKLNAYLRANSHQLRLYLPKEQQLHTDVRATTAPLAVNSGNSERISTMVAQQTTTSTAAASIATFDCNVPIEGAQLEQLAIVQLEIDQLDPQQDKGIYQLEVCSKRNSGESNNRLYNYQPSQCQQLAFSLQVALDVPRLETKFYSQILETGERLSIKCEATAFTLPQISWFLDGQQLSEHQPNVGPMSSLIINHNNEFLNSISDQQRHQQQHVRKNQERESSMMTDGSATNSAAATNLATSLRLRIGDYVSQDNHVHSFVNSSQLQPADAGFYKCQANNGYHSVEHEARIDVRGLPVIARQLQNLTVLVAQSQLHIQCPYGGHPISSVEWYHLPTLSDSNTKQQQQQQSQSGSYSSLDNEFNYQQQQLRSPAAFQFRAKRKPSSEEENGPESQGSFLDAVLSGVGGLSQLDADKDPDPDKDEWLSQASAMLTPPTSTDDYPEPVPDYPGAFDGRPSNQAAYVALDYDNDDPSNVNSADQLQLMTLDYSDIPTDFQQQQDQQQKRRKKRQALVSSAQEWIKLPQSRRHQVHLNGTLIIQEVRRADQGFYKCRVLASSPLANEPEEVSPSAGGSGFFGFLGTSGVIDRRSGTSQQQQHQENHFVHVASSNEFHLQVLVPPVISPFTSLESLREGMRNFLTCSVIEGDSPVRLRWLKDNQPIELEDHSQQNTNNVARIRLEASNEYTSTLYFSHVDFNDNGNYTCMATNKAASVNYTTKMLVNVPPKWIKSPKDLDCVAGQNIVIDCQAQAHPNARVWWEIGVVSPSSASSSVTASNPPEMSQLQQFNSNNNKSANNKDSSSQHQHHQQLNHPPNHYRTIISNSRIHILENASLVIRDVHKLDQGYYLCQAANNFGSLSSLIKLTVNVGASFASKYLVKYTKLGDRVELDCDPIGESPVEVNWYWRQPASQRQVNNNNNSIWPTPPIMRHHQSNQNETSQLGYRMYMGTVRTELQHRQATNSNTTTTTTTSSTSGSEIQQQQSQLDPLLFQLDSSLAFELVRRSEGGGELVRLVIKQARRLHSADFVCQASNRFGSDEKLIKLLVQEAPDPVQEISANQINSRSISISWLTPYNGNSPITSYTIEWSPVSVDSDSVSGSTVGSKLWSSHMTVQQTNSATIGPLKPLATYQVRVRAHNQFGTSLAHTSPESSSPALFTTSEEAPSSPPGDIKALPLSSSSIQVSWLPSVDHSDGLSDQQQKFSVKGYYLGYKVAHSNESYVFKTISLNDHELQLNDSSATIQRQQNHHYLKPAAPLVPGTPQPNFSHALVNRERISKSGNNVSSMDPLRVRVLIDDLKRSTKYSVIVQAFNSAGPGPQSDQVEVKTLTNDPPPAPLLRAGLSTYTSIELQWSFQLDSLVLIAPQPAVSIQAPPTTANGGANKLTTSATTNETNSSLSSSDHNNNNNNHHHQTHKQSSEVVGTTVDGYHLFYRRMEPKGIGGQWVEKKLSPESHTIIATGQHQRNDLSIVELDGGLSAVTKLEQPHQYELNAGVESKPISTVSMSPPIHVVGWHNNNKTSSGSNLSLAFKSFRYLLDQLTCGSSYQIYLIAYNSIGSGQASQIIRTKTRGSAPIAPRKQDFISVNSTFLQLNLESWMDGGCSINNFEIRYKQMSSRAATILATNNHPDQTGAGDISLSKQSSWLVLSTNIGSDQRLIELRDLQPESWYLVLSSAESAAGKTEVQYALMTLDKFGQLPAEASLEPSSFMNTGIGASNLPAIFRGNASIRSILSNFSSSSSLASPLIMSACMCLILFATCSLLLIRRYNNLIKADTASLDSQTTSGAFSGHHHHHHDSLGQNFSHHHHAHLQSNPKLQSAVGYGMQAQAGGGNGHHTNVEHYSLKSSPTCKNGTATTMLTNTNSTTNSTSDSSNANAASANTTTCTYARLANSGGDPNGLQEHCQYGTHHLHHYHQQAAIQEEFCSSPGCNEPTPTLNLDLSPSNNNNNSKFAASTLAREAGGSQQHMGNRFKTMPNHHRPVSSFIPVDSYANTNRNFSNNPNCSDNQHQDFQRQQLEQQQAIYSKLRLIYNSDSNYNICPAEQQQQQYQQQQKQPVDLQHPILIEGQMDNTTQQQQLYGAATNEAINLALLSHQQQQKLLACVGATVNGTQTLKQPRTMMNQNVYITTNNGVVENMEGSTQNNELTSLLLDCQQQQQQQQVVDPALVNYAGQYQQSQQTNQLNLTPTEALQLSNGYGFYGKQAPASIASGSGSTTNSTQPASTSSVSNNNSTSPVIEQQQQQQLINVNGTFGTLQCAKTNQLKSNGACGQQQAQQSNNQQPASNEQSDYALPFPPKWV